jgi:uncharacterized protein (DUF2252 family)
MKRRLFIGKVFAGTLITVAMLAGVSHAAAPRDSWVVNELYNYNHPYAAQASNELATKMTKMAASPFAFYRGTASLFYKDMSTLPASSYSNTATSKVWLPGDVHLQNYGALRDDSGNDIFDISDFDEGYFGTYVWDLRRMAVSILLAAKENGLSSADRQQCVRDFLDAYLDQMAVFKGSSDELTYRLTAANTGEVVKDTIQTLSGKTRASLLSKYTTLSGSTRTLQNLSDLVSVPTATYNAINSAMSSYVSSIPAAKQYATSYYSVKDIRQKLGSGVGSLGKMRYYVLIQGPSSSTSDDVILEMKQQGSSAVAIAAPGLMPASAYSNHQGYRMVRSAKAMMSNTDRLYGYTTLNSVPYSLREKSPFQEDFDYTLLNSYGKFNTAVEYMGKVLARAHAMSDQDYDSTLITYSIDKQVNDVVTSRSSFETEIVNFAVDYAAQVEYDWQSLKTARQNGTILY